MDTLQAILILLAFATFRVGLPVLLLLAIGTWFDRRNRHLALYGS